MSRKKSSNLPKSDFDINDNEYLFTFTDKAISDGKCIAEFTFDPDEDLSSEAASLPIIDSSGVVNNSKKTIFNFDNTSSKNNIESISNIPSNTNEKNTTNMHFNNDENNDNTKTFVQNNTNKINHDNTVPSTQNISSDKCVQINTYAEKLFDNRTLSIPNGAAPPINGEIPTVRRSYIFRSSTIRKLNELKSIHPDINACVSTIVDVALEHYYTYITKEGGKLQP